MESLSEFMGKRVTIVDVDGDVHVGDAVSFTDKFDSDSGEESIGLAREGWILSLERSEIRTIEVA